MKQKSHLRQQEEQAAQVHSQTQENGREFASVEEMLRFDASRQTPPARLADRVKESVENEPPAPPLSFWQRIAARLGWRRRD